MFAINKEKRKQVIIFHNFLNEALKTDNGKGNFALALKYYSC